MASDTRDLRRIQRGGSRELSRLLTRIIRAGHRYRMTKSGVMIYGATGTASAHFTTSDHRALENFRTNLKAIGITIEKGK